MDYPAWGQDEDDTPNEIISSSKLAEFNKTPQLNVTSSDNWGDDDGGGWGNNNTTSNSFNSYVTGFNEVEVTTEEIDEVEVDEEEMNKEFNNNKQPIEADWNRSNSPVLSTSYDQTESTSYASTSPYETTDTYTLPSARSLSPTPKLSTLSLDSSSSSEVPAATEDNWGNYGSSPTLAPIIYKNEDSIPVRDLDWGNSVETEMNLPTALPSFGDSFASTKTPVMEEKVTEGWGGAEVEWKPTKVVENDYDAVVQPVTTVESIGDGAWATESSQGLRKGKTISAAFVDGIKDNSRTFAKSNWDLSSDSWSPPGFQEQANLNPILSTLSQPPELPSSSNSTSITTHTPLSSLFKLTPTLYPAFKTGLEKTALRSAETLKGTSSAAYRNAKFGKTHIRNVGAAESNMGIGGESLWDANSTLDIPVLHSDRGVAGDEFDLDGPSSSTMTKKSSWWGASGGQNVNTTNMPSSLLSKKEGEDSHAVGITDPSQSTVSNPPPGAIGRFFGRFGRNTASSDPSPTNSTTSASNPTSTGEISGWSGDLDFLDNAPSVVNNIPRSNEMPVKVIFDDYEEEDHQDPLGTFFGDKSAPPREVDIPADFGGLMGSFGNSAPSRSKILPQSQVQKKKSGLEGLDPFDPFGDDDQLSLAGPPTLTSASIPSSKLNIRTMSPPLLPTSRSTSPAGILAPQARGLSVLPTFDAFGSYSAGPSPASSPAIISPSSIPALSAFSSNPLAPTIVPRPFISPPISLSPIQYTSNKLASLVIPASTNASKQYSGFIPPPVSISRGFGLTPPPPISSSASIPRANFTPPIPITATNTKYIPPTASTTGPLGLDDLSFFEN